MQGTHKWEGRRPQACRHGAHAANLGNGGGGGSIRAWDGSSGGGDIPTRRLILIVEVASTLDGQCHGAEGGGCQIPARALVVPEGHSSHQDAHAFPRPRRPHIHQQTPSPSFWGALLNATPKQLLQQNATTTEAVAANCCVSVPQQLTITNGGQGWRLDGRGKCRKVKQIVRRGVSRRPRSGRRATAEMPCWPQADGMHRTRDRMVARHGPLRYSPRPEACVL